MVDHLPEHWTSSPESGGLEGLAQVIDKGSEFPEQEGDYVPERGLPM